MMRMGDLLAYGAGRAVTAAGMVYFLNRLTEHIDGWLFARIPALSLAKSWPTDSLWLNATILVLGSAALWKLLWDGLLVGFQDGVLNLKAQFRVERMALFIWAVILFIAALTIEIPAACAPDCATLKSYLGWAIGLAVTIILFRAHTIVNSGLVQLWRYGRGSTAFKPEQAENPNS